MTEVSDQPTPGRNDGLDAKKRFEVLLDALKDAYKELTDTALKISGVLLIVVGWFASKDNPLPMLCGAPMLTRAALVFTFLGFVGLTFLFALLYVRARRVQMALRGAGYELFLYQRYVVSVGMVIWPLFGQCTMLIGIFAAIYSSYEVPTAKTCEEAPVVNRQAR